MIAAPSVRRRGTSRIPLSLGAGLGALIAGLSPAPALARAPWLTLDSTFVGPIETGGFTPDQIVVSATPNGSALQMGLIVGPIAGNDPALGEQFPSKGLTQFVMQLAGTVGGAVPAGSKLRVSYRLVADFGGIQFDAALPTLTLRALDGSAIVDQVTAVGFDPGVLGSGQPVVGSFETPVTSLRGPDGEWSFEMVFQWFGFDASETLTIRFPEPLLVVEIISPPCPGDENFDGIVAFGDLTTLLTFWGNDYSPDSGPGDVNGDGRVDTGDLMLLISRFGQSCPS